VQHRHPQFSVVSLGEVYKLLNNKAAEREIRQLQARAYSQQGSQKGCTTENWQGDRLVEALSQSRTRMASKSAASSPLPALYPDELNAGSAR
jgi:hypothetical protein